MLFINVLNNKKIIVLHLVEYALILVKLVNGLVGYVSGDIPRDFVG